jgi:hypothetical protein
MRLLSIVLVLLTTLSTFGCAHSYIRPTGLPSDVGNRFFFHVDHEAQAEGYRTARSESGVTVYAPDGRITYGISGDEIVATLTVPNRSGVNRNYYRQKRIALQELSDDLVEGARARAREAKDFAY